MEIFMKKILLLSALALMAGSAFAEIVSIPMQYTGQPAKDLVDSNGKPLSVVQSKLIWAKTKDLSSLNPKETDIWKDTLGKKLSVSDDDYKISKNEIFDYVDKVVSNVGSFRFVMTEKSSESQKRNFNVWIRKDSRSVLLRKNLLRKLGYNVPKFEHKQNIKVKFKGLASLKAFLDEMELATFADSDRWRIATDEDKFIITLQDVVVFQTSTEIYDLAEGQIGADNIAHRRSLNALAIAYALVDLRESVDGFPWSVGKVNNKVTLLDIISGDAFTTTYNDALWMVKRISKLKEKDFKEIVDQAYFPESVGALLTEKLMARFNSIERIFVDGAKELKVNPEISDISGELVKGRLTQDNWKGHASRYSFDDTESPLSKDEMVAYFKSKFYSGVIDNLVSYVNDNYLYETDIQEAAIERAIQAQRDQFINLFETGKFQKVPFSAWVIPTAKGHISASRDIVTGSYLGTDNLIQIADSIEFIGEVGAFVGTLGVPVEVQLYASGAARFSRSYTHVKSIKSIKKALKEPFRNIIVPNVKRKKSQSIITMIDSLQSEAFQKLEGEERTAEIEKIFKEFNKVLEIGDSLIIANNLILSGTVAGGYKIPLETMNVEAIMQLNTRKVNIWRMHVTRSSDTTFQVYKSRANSFGKGAGFAVKAYVPIISLNFDKQSGKVETKFHSINFSNQDEDKQTIRKLVELRQVLVENSTELMTKSQKPFIINHNFTESSGSGRFLTRQSLNVKLLDDLKITHPEDYVTKFYIRSLSKLRGKNYMQVAYDILNSIIEEKLDLDNVSLRNSESGNPGDSFHGESFSRVTTTEVPYNDEDSEIPFENYSQVKSQWKGWAADKNKLKEIKKEIDRKYGKDIFNDELFYDTNKIKLYTVDVVLSLYASGIENMIYMDHDEYMAIIERELILPWPENRSHFIRRGGRRFNKYKRDRSRIIQEIAAAHIALSSDYESLMTPAQKSIDMSLLIDTAEAMLPFKVFDHIVGGDENYYLKGVINGFRVGTENGEEAIVSHAMGEYGSEFSGGIADTLRNAIKISQGELGAYWFLRRVQ
ncbi:MAG: hypothetical protein ACJAS4_002385 [Bacteriovoracaceae bacterium]